MKCHKINPHGKSNFQNKINVKCYINYDVRHINISVDALDESEEISIIVNNENNRCVSL